MAECTRMDHDGSDLCCECWFGGDVVYVVRLTAGVDYVHEILNHTKIKERQNAQADHPKTVRQTDSGGVPVSGRVGRDRSSRRA